MKICVKNQESYFPNKILSNDDTMKPIFKYSGGKTRELKRINEIIVGIKFDRVVEPFVGGGAFSFDQEKPA